VRAIISNRLACAGALVKKGRKAGRKKIHVYNITLIYDCVLFQLLLVGVVLSHCRYSRCTHHQTPVAESESVITLSHSAPILKPHSAVPAASVVYVELCEPPAVPPRSQRESKNLSEELLTRPLAQTDTPRQVRGTMIRYSNLAKKK